MIVIRANMASNVPSSVLSNANPAKSVFMILGQIPTYLELPIGRLEPGPTRLTGSTLDVPKASDFHDGGLGTELIYFELRFPIN